MRRIMAVSRPTTVWVLTVLLALPGAVALGAGSASAGAAPAAPAAAPVDGITVSGTGVGATYPAFDPEISRYAVTTTSEGDGTVEIAVDAPGSRVLVDGALATGPTTVRGLQPGEEVSVIVRGAGQTRPYAFVYLPAEFPELRTVVNEPGRTPGLVGITPTQFQGSNSMEAIVDEYGVPAYVFDGPGGSGDLKVQPEGTYTVNRDTADPERTGVPGARA